MSNGDTYLIDRNSDTCFVPRNLRRKRTSGCMSISPVYRNKALHKHGHQMRDIGLLALWAAVLYKIFLLEMDVDFRKDWNWLIKHLVDTCCTFITNVQENTKSSVHRFDWIWNLLYYVTLMYYIHIVFVIDSK